MAYFYFDFRNASKQGLHDLVISLLTQLSARSSLRCDVLSELHSVHNNGKQQPGDDILIKCLKVLRMDYTFSLQGALNEDSKGLSSAKE